MLIYIKLFSGKLIPIQQLHQNDTINTPCAKLDEAEGYPAESIKFVYIREDGNAKKIDSNLRN